MHIAAADPKYVRRDEVPPAVLDKEKEIYRAQFAQSGKKPEIIEKIVEGKLDSYYEQVVLLDQKFIRDPAVKVSQLIAEATAKMGENITVRRFARFKIGEAQSRSESSSRRVGRVMESTQSQSTHLTRLDDSTTPIDSRLPTLRL